jgi:hypothetical protein
MYVITDQRFGEPSIITGPSEWRSNFFSFMLSEELNKQIKIKDEDKDRVPFFVEEGIAIRECELVYEPINGAFQRHTGPRITFPEDPLEKVTAIYTAENKSLEELKKHFKDRIANDRWKKENDFIEIIIKGETYMIQTSRSTRDALTQKYIIMEEGDTINWKFRFKWAVLNKEDVIFVLRSIDNHVQNNFDFEKTAFEYIDSAEDHVTLETTIKTKIILE